LLRYTAYLGQDVHTHVLLFTKQYNLVPIKKQWRSASGKVTVGLASHWPCVTGSVVYPPHGLNSRRKGDEHPTYAPGGMAFLLYW